MLESAWPQDPDTPELELKPQVSKATEQMTNISGPETLLQHIHTTTTTPTRKRQSGPKNPSTWHQLPPKMNFH